MKKIFFLLFIVFLLAVIIASFRTIKQKVRNDLRTPLETTFSGPTIMPTIDVKKNPEEKKSLFVPYWTVSASEIEVEDYDTVIYFGVTPTVSGINTSESGYLSLQKFLAKTTGWNNKLLTLRMLDSTNNFTILEDKNKQDAVIREFIETAVDNGFSGVVLDLELSALPFNSVITQINDFTHKLSQAAHDKKLSMGMMMYGDTFYRVRPFEVKTLGGYVDQLYIMAYDFSKARGNPGPNFPLGGKDTYGYDYTSLVQDFVRIIPAKKLTVVFGMYGYDWTVDEKKVATKQGEALSMNKIEKNIITDCVYITCLWERDNNSGEITAEYTDTEKVKHIIWFEDIESVKRKKEFLKKQGITSYSYWAYSYF